MTDEEKKVYDEIVKNISEKQVSKKDIEAMIAESFTGTKKELADLQASAVAQAEAIKAIQEGQKKEETKTLEGILKAKHDDIKKAVENNGKVNLYIPKTAVATTSATTLVGTGQPGIYVPAYAMPTMAQLMGSLGLPSGTDHNIPYWDRTTSTRNADNIAENNTTTDSAMAWTRAYKPIEKIFDWIPFTKEVVYDIAWMQQEIDKFVRENLMLKEDYQLLHGTGSTPQIQGLYDVATAFDATDYAAKFKSGNLFNLILAVGTKISNGKDSIMKATHCIVNPIDFLTLLGNQNDFGSYDFPPFAQLNGATINVGGITVVANSNITADTALVCDMTKQSRYAGGIEIEIGYNASDIIYDRLTMVGRIREAVVIPTNHLLGFYKIESIAADIAEIGTPAS